MQEILVALKMQCKVAVFLLNLEWSNFTYKKYDEMSKENYASVIKFILTFKLYEEVVMPARMKDFPNDKIRHVIFEWFIAHGMLYWNC